MYIIVRFEGYGFLTLFVTDFCGYLREYEWISALEAKTIIEFDGNIIITYQKSMIDFHNLEIYPKKVFDLNCIPNLTTIGCNTLYQLAQKYVYHLPGISFQHNKNKRTTNDEISHYSKKQHIQTM